MKSGAYLLLCCLLLFGCKSDSISPQQAKIFIGDTKTVCGRVVEVSYKPFVRGSPTFINLDQKYPNQLFTIVIWGKDQGNFDRDIEKQFFAKRICVTGTITEYRGKPQIVIKDENQIKTE